jgi:hypothetical protein
MAFWKRKPKEKKTKEKKPTEFEKAKFYAIKEGDSVMLMFREEGFRPTEFWIKLSQEELTKLINVLIGVETNVSNL